MPLAIGCTNEQKVPVTAAPVSAQGNPAPVEGALIVTVLSGDGTVEQDPLSPLTFKAVSGLALGDTVYKVEADADLGAGTQLIEDLVTLTVTSASAVSFGLVPGVPEPKGAAPVVTPQRSRRP